MSVKSYDHADLVQLLKSQNVSAIESPNVKSLQDLGEEENLNKNINNQ
jgi:hypothetical protein